MADTVRAFIRRARSRAETTRTLADTQSRPSTAARLSAEGPVAQGRAPFIMVVESTAESRRRLRTTRSTTAEAITRARAAAAVAVEATSVVTAAGVVDTAAATGNPRSWRRYARAL